MPLNRVQIRQMLKQKLPYETILEIYSDEGYHRGAVKQVIKLVQEKMERDDAKREKQRLKAEIRSRTNGGDREGRNENLGDSSEEKA